jgi:biopolymer transport protein TolR
MAGPTNTVGQPMSAINVTPFVDIVLVLLVVLMVSSVHIVRAALEVDLPRASSAGKSVASTLNIVIKNDGALLVDGTPTSSAALAAMVREQRKANPKLQAVISADKGVVYQRVIGAIDLVKRNGVVRFALNIERSPASGEQ